MPDKDSVPAPPDAQSTASDKELGSPQANELKSLQNELYELKERIFALKEGELFALKEKQLQLSTSITKIFAIGTAVVAALAIMGFKEFADLNSLIRKTASDRFDKSVGYYEQELKALWLVRTENNCAGAIPILRNLHSERPDDEVSFYLLLHCLAVQGDFDTGYQFIEKAKQNYDFFRTYQMPLTLNNAGRILLEKGLDQPNLLPEALTLLQQAKRRALNENDSNINLILTNLMFYYVLEGDMSQAKVCASQWREIMKTEWNAPSSEDFLKRLERIRPSARSDLQSLIGLTAPNSSP
jgi:tetratricopeptide (TPR) repeat protein